LTKDEALKLALEALNKTREYQQGYAFAVTAAKNIAEALAQPVQRPWVGLTETEIDEWTPEIHGVIRSIEAKLKEKNFD